MIMDWRPFSFLILQIFGLCSTVSTSSRTHNDGSAALVQKRSISNNKCLQLQAPTSRQLNEFGIAFTNLSLGLHHIPSNFAGDVILFVGNTGVGKSSLVHLLAGEGANFVAEEDGVDSGDFRIQDITGRFVSNTRVVSTTTYPEAVLDTKTGTVLVDTPGFGDTRSAAHEIVAAYGLHSVAAMSQRIKIALLVNYNSLTPLGLRDDFTNTLRSFFSMFNNTHKLQDSTYLIVTKTENRYIKRKGEKVLVSPESQIKSIAQFMNGVSQVMEDHKGEYGDNKFIKNAQALIASLNKGKIALFKKPDQTGPLSGSLPLQQSLQSIHELLLINDGYVTVDKKDLGFAISDKAKMYIRELYDLMNKHVEEVSTSFVKSFKQFLIGQSKDVDNIETIQSSLKQIEHQVEHLIRKINTSSTPSQYIDAVLNMAASVNMEFCNQNAADEMRKLDGYLDGLKKLTDHHHYTPSKWAETLNPLQQLVQNEIMYYNMLDDMYKKITDYSSSYSSTMESTHGFSWSNVEELKDFLKKLELMRFADLQVTPEKLAEISLFLNKVVGERSITCYQSHTLVIVDSVLRTSNLDLPKMTTCKQTSMIVLVALRKLYIDADLWTQGRSLVVIAPEWHNLGHFTLSVDGKSAEDELWARAAPGREGLDGKPGRPGGHFVGVVLKLVNSEQLTISARGGNGGRGQDGGDGEDGRDGKDGIQGRHRIDYSSSIYVIYNSFKTKYLIKADHGSDGGDAGHGGLGGAAGLPGSVAMHSLSKLSPDRSTRQVQSGSRGRDGYNGSPGRAGLRGCDIIETEYEGRFLFIPAGRSKESSYFNCNRRGNSNGRVRPRSHSLPLATFGQMPALPPICDLFKLVKHQFEASDVIVSQSVAVQFREAFVKQFHCY